MSLSVDGTGRSEVSLTGRRRGDKFMRSRLERCLLVLFGCAAAMGLPAAAHAAGRSPATPGEVRVMVMVKGTDQQRSQGVENVLIQAFQRQGFKVIDTAAVAQALRRNAELLKLYDVEAAKRLGSGLGADMLSTSHTRCWRGKR
jgi:hypothetical protein